MVKWFCQSTNVSFLFLCWKYKCITIFLSWHCLMLTKALLCKLSMNCWQTSTSCTSNSFSVSQIRHSNEARTSGWRLCRLLFWQEAFVSGGQLTGRRLLLTEGDAAGREDVVMSYPAPGPAGRTTALPLRSQIPPFSLSLAWVTPSLLSPGNRRAKPRCVWNKGAPAAPKRVF